MERVIELLKYIFLCFIQGFGEILPISSSGHLMIFRKILNINEDNMQLEIILHLASLLALFVFYWKTIASLVKGTFLYVIKKKKGYYKDYCLFRSIVIGLIPLMIVGYCLNDYLDSFFKSIYLVGIALIINGINLYLVKNKKGNKSIEELSLLSLFKLGIGQCLGLVPGISRSGSALSMCYREKLNKEEAEKYTFLMLFPLVIGSLILNISSFSLEFNLLYIISFVLTSAITYLSLGLLRKLINSNRFYYFSYYCIIMGLLVILLGYLL